MNFTLDPARGKGRVSALSPSVQKGYNKGIAPAGKIPRSGPLKMTHDFNPDWTAPPGFIVEELREERRISLHDLAGMLGLTVPEVLQLERGELPLDPLLAERLEYVFGMPEATWLRMEQNYRNDLAKELKVTL